MRLEIVKKYKYVEMWFSTGKAFGKHIKKNMEKIIKAINATWGIFKRARINNLRRRLFLMDSTVKAATMYGVELWGWERHDTIEKVQGRYTKASMGLSRNTPDYIWKLEAGKRSIAVEVLRRAGNFVLRI